MEKEFNLREKRKEIESYLRNFVGIEDGLAIENVMHRIFEQDKEFIKIILDKVDRCSFKKTSYYSLDELKEIIKKRAGKGLVE